MTTSTSDSSSSIQLLDHVLRSPHLLQQLPQNLIPVILTFIDSLLQVCVKEPSPDLRHRLLILIQRLREHKIPLPTSSWPSFIILFGQQNRNVTESVLSFAANDDHPLNRGWATELDGLVQQLVDSLSSPHTPATSRTLHLLRLISQSSPIIISSLARGSDGMLRRLIDFYKDLLPQSPISAEESPTNSARYDLLLTVYSFLEADLLVRLRSITPATDPLGLLERLESLFLKDCQSTQRFVHDLLDHVPSLYDLICSLQNDRFCLKPQLKQKLKELIEMLELSNPHTGLQSIVEEILEVLPEVEPKTIVLEVIQKAHYLVKGTGPAQFIDDYLQNQTSKASQPSHQEALEEVLRSRKNIFDDHQLNPSLLKKGKNRINEQLIMEDKSHLTEEIRAKIKARAEAVSSDEEDSERDRGRVLFVDDDDEEDIRITQARDIFEDDDEAFFGPSRISEEEEEEEDDDDRIEREPKLEKIEERGAGPVLNLRSNQPILYRAYVERAQVFDKSSRGTKERKALKERLGDGSLADDLLESWRLMLERDPDKEKILSKYSFAAEQYSKTDHVGPSNAGHRAEAETRGGGGDQRGSGRSAGRGRGRGGGGERGGRGRGGGERGRGRGRGKDSSNKFAHDRRVRGRDKKLKQMAGPG